MSSFVMAKFLPPLRSSFSDELFLLQLVEEKLKLEDLEDLTLSYSIPLFDALHRIRAEPTNFSSWPAEAFKFIGRLDLLYLKTSSTHPRVSWNLSDISNWDQIINGHIRAS